VLAGPDPARDGVVAFRLVDVHSVAGEDFDVEASFTTVWREMKRQGLSWLSPRPQNPRADDAAQEDLKKTSAPA
jgi:transposase